MSAVFGLAQIMGGDAMTVGKIASFDSPQGYSIVRVAGSRHALLVDRSAVERSESPCLLAGQDSEYDVICDRSGTLIARNLRTPAVHS
jgi:cold shock CspA family protein